MIIGIIGIIGLAVQLAEPPPVEPNGNYDCKARQGSYEEKKIAGGKRSVRITGNIKVESTDSVGGDYWSIAGVAFHPPKSRRGVGLMVWLTKNDKLAYGIRLAGSDTPSPLGEVPKGQPISFDIGFNRFGTMLGRVNGQGYRLQGIPFPPDSPFFTCAAGHFKFEDVKIVVAD